MSTYSKYFDKIRVSKKKDEPVPDAAPTCQWDGCEKPGTHKAPVGRQQEGEYFCFCKDHVSRYNKSFNYFSGVPDTEVARYQKEALTGHRPTWKVGTNSASGFSSDFADVRSGSAQSHRRLRDPLGLQREELRRATPHKRKVKPLESKALDTLGLPEMAKPEDIRAQYKLLIKQHHPDANGGDRASEDRFRAVLEAYRLLKQAGLC
jgi:curved DNA-binding protein CbpA